MKARSSVSALSAEQRHALMDTLEARFDQNRHRHADLSWHQVKSRLEAAPAKLWSLQQMELTGGEPDVIGCDPTTGALVFVDCSSQSPEARGSLCYDAEALAARKKFKPKNSAMSLAAEMGVELLTEEQYFELQRLGEFDTKSSSWLQTPADIRRLGGALFGDRRFGRVFVYHNGADAYFGGRGFRARLMV